MLNLRRYFRGAIKARQKKPTNVEHAFSNLTSTLSTT
jgi:hypothetical protein